MIPTSGINSIQPTQQLASFVSLSSDIPLEIRSFSMDTLCTNKEESTLNRTETENPKCFASHFSFTLYFAEFSRKYFLHFKSHSN
ncbi:hypothetical protein CEXT_228511 [Caerostris extrusa]|uniref:Uncharacterized protein n=1 Tax=Caerostris extrusa TaxID=172846 RepID=A0AAV4XYF8_CAEEX|nr:hypothetical protein CEXT_228511 [Caerostris extrusa]